jgi:hypothetical protein
MTHASSCHCYPIMTAVLIAFLATNLRFSTAADENAKVEAKKPTELSVAPTSHQEFASSRPNWVDASPSLEGDVHRLPVTSIPCRTESLCEDALKANMRGAVDNYIETLTGSEESSGLILLDDQWISEHRDKSKYYIGTVLKGEETLYESATELVFEKEDQEMIQRLWRRHQVNERLAILGFVSGLVVTSLIGVAATLSMVTRRAEQRVAM